MPAVVCVIPALNAEPTLGAVIVGLRHSLPAARIVVVDDGSTDGTRRLAETIADATLAHDRNMGKGAALRSGFAEARRHGAEVILTIDADGQHDPSRAAALVDALADADVVIGVRERIGTRMPLRRRFSNALSSAFISRCAGCPLPDTQSGYRAIRAEVIDRIQPRGDRYEFETDFIILAARAGFRIIGVPIPTIYGAPSHFNEIKDTLRVARMIWYHREKLL